MSGRETALDSFLDEQAGNGFAVESRTATQAIIVRRGWAARLPGRFLSERGTTRQVISVDEHGAITVQAAEPRRW